MLSPSDDDNPVNPVSVLIVLWISPFLRNENIVVMYDLVAVIWSQPEKTFQFFSK